MKWLLRKWRLHIFKRRISTTRDILAKLDVSMIKLGYSRQERRHFWRGFIKHDALHMEALDRMLGAL